MSALSNYLEALIVTDYLQDVGNPVYLALFTDDPTDAGLITDLDLYTGYQRVAATWSNLSAGGQTSNLADIEFAPNGNAASLAVDINYAAIMDHATKGQGNVLIHGPLAPVKTLAVGDVLAFAAGALIMTLN